MRRKCSSFATPLSVFSGGTLTDFRLESCLTRLNFLSRGVTGVVDWGRWGDRGSTSNCEDRCRSRCSLRTCRRPLSAAVSEIMLISSAARLSSSSIASNSSSSSPKAMQTQVRRDALTPVRSHYVHRCECVCVCIEAYANLGLLPHFPLEQHMF